MAVPRDYTAWYKVADASAYDPHVGVVVATAQDAAGNVQTSVPARTTSPSTRRRPRPTSSTVVPNLWKITDMNTAQAQPAEAQPRFTLRVYYDQPMAWTPPTFTFSPDVSSTLTFDHGFWTGTYNDPGDGHVLGGRDYTAWYDVSDANVPLSYISVAVTGAQTVVGGNVYDQARYNRSELFAIDTVDPSPVRAQVQSVDTSVALVTDDAVTPNGGAADVLGGGPVQRVDELRRRPDDQLFAGRVEYADAG